MRRMAGSPAIVLPAIVLLASVAFGSHFNAQSAADAASLVRGHEWFAARLAATPESSPFVRGAIANAFGDAAAAEPLLKQVVAATPASPDADDAYATLAELYIRAGKYATFAQVFERWSGRFPASTGVARERDNYEKFRGRPDQINGSRQRSRLRHDDDFFTPVTIDGKTDTFLFDTGAWQSAMTLAAATRLGMKMSGDVKYLTDLSGSRTPFRTAIAKEVVLGGVHFGDVSFAIIEPAKGSALEGADFGIVGMPILTHMVGLQWSKGGRLDFGPLPSPMASASATSRSPAAAPNLVFDRHRLLVSARVESRDVLAVLDTGANTTTLNANFADAFPGLMRQGIKTTDALNGVGNSRIYDAWTLPQVTFTIGPTPVTLTPATVFNQRLTLLGGECCIANGGQDLLAQGEGFSIDFARMILAIK